MIWFDGISSDEMNVNVESYPARSIPKRKMEIVSVPGRSGDLIFPQEAYENYDQTYSVYVSAIRAKLHNIAGEIIEWLSKSGYRRLEDSYDPEIYRMAYYSGGKDIENFFDEFGRAEIVFTCMPQRYMKYGEREIYATNGMTLRNPTMYPAKPLIKVTGSGNGTLTVGANTIALTGINEFLMIDSEAMDCYKGAVNENAKMSGNFPELRESSVISWTGAITAVDIVPRWYRL